MDINAVNRQLNRRLGEIMATDAAWCRKKQHHLRQRVSRGQPIDRLVAEMLKRFDTSRKKVEARIEAMPRPDYDEALPIAAHREAIIEAIRDHQVIIVAGETGSGKTTQLPKLCLEAGRGARGMIACTQPRRIAARAMADRVCEELGVELGGTVGYQVRFRDRSSPDSIIKFMTDGILLAETLNDKFLDQYDTIIIDEAHERSLNIDFLLGYLRQLLGRRPDLRLIVTSATIDTAKFSQHFGDAPIIEVSGRTYPVDVIYQPLADGDESAEPGDRDLYRGIEQAVSHLTRIDPVGDILVFLSGEREIREAGKHLQRSLARQRGPGTEILPLYARLSNAEQRRVFHPGPARRIVLATNVAETSLTVPRIRFVIDSGFARISRYAHRSRIQRLPIEPVSRASANQRMGRCGRLGPGTCIRLFSEEDFQARPEYTEPEILRTSLASVILRMLTMGLGAVEDFPFVDSPAPRMIRDAYQLLTELGALDADRRPTRLGKQLVHWPMDVRLARIVIEGAQQKCLEDVMVLAAALSIQDPRERPLDAQAAADESHGRFADPQSDFVSLLNLWKYLREQRHQVSGNQFRKLCRREFLNWQRVLEWFDLYQQLRDKAREDRLPLSGNTGTYESIHKSLLSGFLSHVGLRHPEDPGYQGARSRGFHIFPGSGLFGRNARWIMAAEIVETSRTWARTNAVVKPEWIEQIGAHLLKRHLYDPHWSRKRGAVMAWEQVSLFGLVLVERRRVHFAGSDPVEARRIFIREALVRGELDIRAAFVEHNERIRREVEQLEHKRRKRDVIADEHAQYDFFDARLPDSVNSLKSFREWLRSLGAEGRDLLNLGHDVLMRDNAGTAPEDLFPDRFQVEGQQFPLSYRFEPGHEHDGVTITVPLEMLNTLDEGRLQWLVPGLLRDKLIALIKQLPKPIRRSLTPAPAFADALLEALQDRQEEAMLPVMAATLKKLTGLEVLESELDESAIDPHLRFLVRVVDEHGEELACRRDLGVLQHELGQKAQRRFMNRQGGEYMRDGETSWVFGDLPLSVTASNGGKAWPALVDQDTAVGLRLFDTWEEAALSHADGVLRLLSIGLAQKVRYVQKRHGLSSRAQLVWTSIGSVPALATELAWKSLRETAGDIISIRTENEFKSLGDRVQNTIVRTGLDLAAQLNETLELYGSIRTNLDDNFERNWPETFADVNAQMDDLVYDGFLADLEPGRLKHYPRYLQAIEERLDQNRVNPQRDTQRLAQVRPWWNRYTEALQHGEIYDEQLDAFRWLVEEFRVSLFAQRLGTAGKVSEKRLEQSWQKTGL